MMKILIIDGDERWTTDTTVYGEPERSKIEAALNRDGHICEMGRAIITIDTIRKMITE